MQGSKKIVLGSRNPIINYIYHYQRIMCDCNDNTDEFCGSWTTKAPMITPRELFAATSGHDKDGSSPTSVDIIAKTM